MFASRHTMLEWAFSPLRLQVLLIIKVSPGLDPQSHTHASRPPARHSICQAAGGLEAGKNETTTPLSACSSSASLGHSETHTHTHKSISESSLLAANDVKLVTEQKWHCR